MFQTELEEDQSKRIGIIGSGDFGRALAGRLAQAGYYPTIGSRDPEQNRSEYHTEQRPVAKLGRVTQRAATRSKIGEKSTENRDQEKNWGE